MIYTFFSAFGEEALFTRLEDAKTKAIITTRKHAGKIRRIRERLPALEKVIVVDAEAHPINKLIHRAIPTRQRIKIAIQTL